MVPDEIWEKITDLDMVGLFSSDTLSSLGTAFTSLYTASLADFNDQKFVWDALVLLVGFIAF